MFSLKPCTTYLHNNNNNNNNTRDGYNKQKRKYSLRIENEKKSRASYNRHPQRFISCVSAAMARRRWRLRRPFKVTLYYNKLFIITTRIIILCARKIRQIFSTLFLFSKNCSIIIYYYYWDPSGRLTDRKNSRLQFSAPECRVNGGK